MENINNKIKVIFLNINGVLNNEQTIINTKKKFDETGVKDLPIDEYMVKLLSALVKETGAKVVLLSSWYDSWDNPDGQIVKNILNSYGIEIIGITSGKPKEDTFHDWRVDEINGWIDSHIDTIESFVILDNDHFIVSEELNLRLIRTSVKIEVADGVETFLSTGLQPHNVPIAIDILNVPLSIE